MENLTLIKKKLVIKIIKLLKSNEINSLPMKLYSDDDDMDVVVINPNEYNKAKLVLKNHGWKLKNNKSKLRERDKDFFHHASEPYVTHLHKHFSWNTITYLDSNLLWKRKRKYKNLIVPSIEDELLIIAAHSFFENQQIKQEEVYYGKKLLKTKIDINYIKSHANKYNWQEGIEITLKKIPQNNSTLTIFEILKVKINKIISDYGKINASQFFVEIFNYFIIDWIWNYRLMLLKKLRQPKLISISGVDGSGKTTGTEIALQTLEGLGKTTKIIHTGKTPLTKNVCIDKKYANPFLGYIIFLKDAMFIFFTLLRYRLYDVILFDRYIYDSIAKISYKQNKQDINLTLLKLSKLILPTPQISLVLLANPKTSYTRDYDHNINYHEEKYSLYKKMLKKLPFLIPINADRKKKEVGSDISREIRKLL